MTLSFPEKYHAVAKYFDFYIGDLEQTPLLTDAQRLMFYALRQQADHGPCTTPTPSLWYMTERHKHQAWQQVSRMSTFEAMVFFVQQFERVLWDLEHPDDNTGSSSSTPGPSTAIRVDWPSRLKEIEGGETTFNGEAHEEGHEHASTHDDKHASQDLSKGPGNASAQNIRAPTPAAAPSAPTAAPSTSAAHFSTEETTGWDADIVAHSTLSLDSIRFLATELMSARQALRDLQHQHQQQQQELASHTEPLVAAVAAATVSQAETTPATTLVKEQHDDHHHHQNTPNHLNGPPLKPVWTVNGNAMRVPIIPPPVRLSARSMTEAAVRVPFEAPHVKALERSGHDGTAEASGKWFGW